MFRIEVEVTPLERRLRYEDGVFSIGSCFAQSVAQKMERVKLRVATNPFGVLYNPISIADALETLESGRRFSKTDLVKEDDLWSCFSFHGSFSSPDAKQALRMMNKAVDMGAKALLEAEYVIITLGSAWVYELREGYVLEDTDGVEHEARAQVVANCHKFPAVAFNRRRLSVEQIVARYDSLLSGVLAGKRVVISVSPVRHVKDGLHQNSISKAVLTLAITEIMERHSNVEYFPSYEIMNDELRDYRFYADDMIHPSQVAVEYIWGKFSQSALSPDALICMGDIERMIRAASHRPLNPNSQNHIAFLASMLEQTQKLQRRYPYLDFSHELEHFGNK